MVGLHLGRAQAVRDPHQRYVAFVANVEALERAIGFRGFRRELDRYLWSLDPRTPINGEMRRLFEDGGQELEDLVHSA
ncbi:MAG TPA: hypothetical protein VMS76_05425 [Planctomycetota bacterium]|nr:hypothetical protein [Planctomycetota bacterium]